MKDIPEKNSTGNFSNHDENSANEELKDTVTSSGQTLTSSDPNIADTNTTQVAEALSRYSAGGGQHLIDSGTTNNYILSHVNSFTPFSAYYDGMTISFVGIFANTGVSTVNIDGQGVKDVVTFTGIPLPASTILPNRLTNIQYDLGADRFVLLEYSSADLQSTIPVGTIIHVYGNNSVFWLEADGSELSRSAFIDLFTYATTAGVVIAEASWATNKGFFGAGDGSTTFRLPDLGGYFIRNLETNDNVDPNRTNADIATIQGDAIRGFSGRFRIMGTWTSFTLDFLVTLTREAFSHINESELTAGVGFLQPSSVNEQYLEISKLGPENRPKNIALKAVMKVL